MNKKTITVFNLDTRKVEEIIDTSESGIVTGKDLYQFFSQELGWSKVKLDRLKALVRYKNPKVKNHPLTYRSGTWVISIQKFKHYYNLS